MIPLTHCERDPIMIDVIKWSKVDGSSHGHSRLHQMFAYNFWNAKRWKLWLYILLTGLPVRFNVILYFSNYWLLLINLLIWKGSKSLIKIIQPRVSKKFLTKIPLVQVFRVPSSLPALQRRPRLWPDVGRVPLQSGLPSGGRPFHSGHRPAAHLPPETHRGRAHAPGLHREASVHKEVDCVKKELLHLVTELLARLACRCTSLVFNSILNRPNLGSRTLGWVRDRMDFGFIKIWEENLHNLI